MAPRLLIIDDDPQITSALVRGLTLHKYTAVAENRADRALERLTTEEFAGAIVDVMLGADNGIELVRAARQAGVTLPILMLSALSEVEHRTAGLEAGADDYVVKPFSFDELVARLRVQENRIAAQRSEPAQLDPETRTLRRGADSVALTEREYALLDLLVQNTGTPMSRGALYDALWQSEGASTENVVDVYIGYLRRKLSQADFGYEIKTLRSRGFCLEKQVSERESRRTQTKV